MTVTHSSMLPNSPVGAQGIVVENYLGLTQQCEQPGEGRAL